MYLTRFCFFLIALCCYLGTNANSNSIGVYSYSTFLEKQNCFNSTDGVIKYIDEGTADNKVIVLLHGVPTSGWMYRKVIPLLVDEGYRVIVPDMLGFGNSDSPNGTDIYNPEHHAARLLELMDLLQIDSWTQVVHDAGSIWADVLIQKYPERVEKLVFLNAYICPEGVNWNQQIGTGLRTKLGLKFLHLGIQKNSFVSRFIADNLTQSSLNYGELKGYEKPIEAGKTQAIFAHYNYVIAQLEAGKAFVSSNALPVSIIWGTKDNVLRLNSQRKVIQQYFKINPASIHELPVGHLVAEESSVEVSAIISNFIQPK